MNILRLKDGAANQVEVVTYPDGQRTVRVDLDYYDVKTPIIIKARIKEFSDFELLFCIISALHINSRMIFKVEYKYVFGLRSDRPFQKGEPDYSHVLSTMMNVTHSKTESVLFWPHSIKNLFSLSNSSADFSGFTRWGYTKIGGDQSTSDQVCDYKFHKKRNSDGTIKSIHLDQHDIDAIKTEPFEIIIVDDLCDGGATFIAEAQYLKLLFPQKKLNLFVAHGIFSKGFHELFDLFDHIYTTNSYRDFENMKHEKLTIIDVWSD
jgi:ribose-phosphate pyrophosphokinase